MTETDHIVAETTQRIFRELGDPQVLARSSDTAWQAELWAALEDAGLTRAWIPEDLNGAGASIADGFEVLRIAGTFAVAVPLAETLLAGWLLARAGISVPDGPLAIAPARGKDVVRAEADGVLMGIACAIPFARVARHLAVFAEARDGPKIALVARAACVIEAGQGIADEPLDRVTFERVHPLSIAPAPADFTFGDIETMGAAVRAVQMGGALEALLDRTVAHANERVAFERPIGRFQAIQHAIARLAGEAAAATTAAVSAADTLAQGGSQDAVLLEVASAKIRAGEAASACAAIAHQIHGAIGFSREHALHRYTQRLWAWRDDFGTESAWALRLGQAAAARGASSLWSWLATR